MCIYTQLHQKITLISQSNFPHTHKNKIKVNQINE